MTNLGGAGTGAGSGNGIGEAVASVAIIATSILGCMSVEEVESEVTEQNKERGRLEKVR